MMEFNNFDDSESLFPGPPNRAMLSIICERTKSLMPLKSNKNNNAVIAAECHFLCFKFQLILPITSPNKIIRIDAAAICHILLPISRPNAQMKPEMARLDQGLTLKIGVESNP